jgi:VacB/RNase II family 3'-5' exoribonuclease
MRTSIDHSVEIDTGLDVIRRELQIPGDFPAEVEQAARDAVDRGPGPDHVDRTDLPFVTLDPADATDLDQALHLERSGDDLLLRYAIADVGWFVRPGDALDREAWRRGTTMYVPNGKAPLHPTVLSEGAASLLPDGPRPAVVFVVRLGPDGTPRLDGVERALVRSRAKLAYDRVTDGDLPDDLPEFARRMAAADERRGAGRLEAPEQEVEHDDGGYRISFRPRLASEDHNAALSLATNLAVATALHDAGTGLFRVMDEPDARQVKRLRHTARAMGIDWPNGMDLVAFERTLRGDDPRHAAMILAVRRAGGGARYVPYESGVVPWHAAMAATYAHATAPLRRLADRHVVLASLAVANGKSVPDEVQAAFAELPAVMSKADALGNRLDRLVIDLVEAVVLQGEVGRTFDAIVTDVDDRGARIQLCDVAVVARVDASGVEPGERIIAKLVAASPQERSVTFERVA